MPITALSERSDLIKLIVAGGDALGRWQSGPIDRGKRAIGRDQGAWRQKWRQRGAEPARELGIAHAVRAADIGMNEHSLGPAFVGEGGQRVVEIAEPYMGGIGDRSRVRRDFAIKHKNIARGEALAQMVKGPAIAEPKLEDDAGAFADQRCGVIKTGTLRRNTTNKRVEARGATQNSRLAMQWLGHVANVTFGTKSVMR